MWVYNCESLVGASAFNGSKKLSMYQHYGVEA